MPVQQRSIILRLVRALLPTIISGLVVLGLFQGYLVYQLTHPRRTAEEVTPQQYSLLTGGTLPWSAEQWENHDSTKAVGWFLRGVSGAPAIILIHSYGKNRSELLNLGVKLREAGYHVLLPDLRGHGASPVSWTSLGDYEREDLLAAINFVKSKRDGQGRQLIDGQRIGVYGVSLGGYIALTAAAEDPTIRAVIVDSIFPTPDWLTRAWAQELFNFDLPLLNRLVNFSLRCYFLGRYSQRSALEAFDHYQGKKLWLVTSSAAGEFERLTLELYQQAPEPKQLSRLEYSRFSRLQGVNQDLYDDLIVSYFRRELPRIAP
jgi:pimeloyl-ACP methyl ester carboxylesterase